MGNYYILSIDSFIDTFSLVETSAAVYFSLAAQKQAASQKPTEDFSILQPGDLAVVYRKSPVAKANVILGVRSVKNGKIEFQKLLEAAGGTDLSEIADELENNYLIQINAAAFDRICKDLLRGVPLNVQGTNIQGITVHGTDEKTDKTDKTRVIGGTNVLLYGVPGAGKSHEIQENYCSDPTRIERVVFHPDYTYSDFVGQILPKTENGQIKYIFTPGPFTRMLKKAWDDPENKYYLVIEEINRGNAPAIFGEIFQLLDRKDADSHKYKESEYGESEYGISNLEVAEAVYGKSDGNSEQEVRIPSNMWVLATMNTADQNIFTLDTAFQRRWNMRHIKNDVYAAEHAECKIEGSDIAWGDFASVINDMALSLNAGIASSEDKRLGAYFVKKSELSKEKFAQKVLKYLWDDVFKMEREAVFLESFRSLDSVIDAFREEEEDSLKAVLKYEVYQKMADRMKNRAVNG